MYAFLRVFCSLHAQKIQGGRLKNESNTPSQNACGAMKYGRQMCISYSVIQNALRIVGVAGWSEELGVGCSVLKAACAVGWRKAICVIMCQHL